MKWTKEQPKAAGLYWYKQADGAIEYIDLDENMKTETGASVEEITEWWEIVAWCGPLKPPEFDLEI